MSTATQARPGGPVRLEPPKAIKARRRHGLIAFGVALVAVGALAAGWLVQSTTTSNHVLAIARDVARGDRIEAAALVAVPVQGSSALRTVAADDLDKVTGKVATVDLRSGALLAPDSYSDNLTPGERKSLVGVSLDAAHRPGVRLYGGETVRFIQAPTTGGDLDSSGIEVAAVVVSTTAGDSSTGSVVVVNVEVDVDEAAQLAALGASGRATLLVDAPGARSTRPTPTETSAPPSGTGAEPGEG